ncbi:CvpA family protein, partial [Escherichia coli]|uniref:CvpA family protein n=2 Tax=Pseudomonadota TaxID=1224 RepID=UPI003A0FD0CD
MAFTFFDYGVAFILVASALIGVLRGLVREVLALVGWVVAFVLAYHFGGIAAQWMPESLPG